jgi:hypothetical protein
MEHTGETYWPQLNGTPQNGLFVPLLKQLRRCGTFCDAY